ncbi:DnaJ domain-containing protein [Kaarinaea lacus]
MRILLILVAVVVLLLVLRALARRSSLDLKKLGRQLLLVLAGGLLLFLLATGRLHWLFALGAASLPVLYRLLPLIRYMPLLRNVYRRYQTRQQGASGSSTGQTSTVQSAYLRMTLNLDTGDMEGEVLIGLFQGQHLQDLSLEQLLSLLSECQHDQDSQALLIAYLDRHHEDWRDSVVGEERYEETQQSQSPSGSSKMSKHEACEILGLSADATEKDIIKAHRRLMQKLHPDRGGSTYLAAKINLAKEVLLNKS